MTDLVAIVRATRKSAKALERMQHAVRDMEEAKGEAFLIAQRRHTRALKDFAKAQAVLRANPLPGDAP